MAKQVPVHKEDNEIKTQIHLSEFDKLRDEMLHFVNAQQQIVMVTLGSVSIVVPLIISQTANIHSSIIASVLYALTVIYAALTMYYAFQGYCIGVIAKYFREHTAPALNRLVATAGGAELLQWDFFVSKQRGTFPDLLLSSLGSIGSSILLLLPGAFTLVVAQYVLLIPSLQSPQPASLLQFVASLLVPLSVLAWFTYILAVIAMILLAVYHAVKSKSIVMK